LYILEPGVLGGIVSKPPILTEKYFAAPSVFEPENLLREARRQKNLPSAEVPEICILDPDGDIVRTLHRARRTRPSPGWACYHTDLFEFEHAGKSFGIIGCAVGASFAVLVAEQLFVSGCRFLVSMTSAGQILQKTPQPYFMLIDRAMRDEGTSYHYLPPAEFVAAEERLVEAAMKALARSAQPVYRGEIQAILINLGAFPFRLRRGERMAQLVVAPVTRVRWQDSAELTGTARGAGGFGSTGEAAR